MRNLNINNVVGGISARVSADEQSVAKWLKEKGKNECLSFLDFKDSLIQAPKISDVDALSWMYSFWNNKAIAEMDENFQKSRFNLAKTEFQNISAFDGAIVTKRLSGGDDSFSLKSPEMIRRKILMRALYSPILETPSSRLRNLALASLRKSAWEQVNAYMLKSLDKKDNYKSTQVLETGFSGGGVACHGRRYGLAMSNCGSGRIYTPVLYLAGEGNSEPPFFELGVMCYALEKAIAEKSSSAKIGGCAVATVDEESFQTYVNVIQYDDLKPIMEEADQAVNTFWTHHVAEDQQIVPLVFSDKKHFLDGEALETFNGVSEEIARIHVAKKELDAINEALRSQLSDTIHLYAREHGIFTSEIKAPKGLLSMRGKLEIDPDGYSDLINSFPEAMDELTSLKPDAKKMEARLKALGDDPVNYSVSVPDKDKIINFCEQNDLDAPLIESVGFAINSKGNDQIFEQIRGDLTETINFIASNPKQKEDMSDSEEYYDAPGFDFM